MRVFDNWYGTAPPTVSPNSTPVAPALLSPAGRSAVVGSSVTFEWGSVPGAVDYMLIVSTSPKMSDEASHKLSERAGNTTAYTDAGYEGNGTKYYWWVVAYAADGRSSLLVHVEANGRWFRSVTAALDGVTVSFNNVITPGNTSYTSSPTNPYGTMPEGFKLHGQFVDVMTTAEYGPPATIGMSYDSGTPNPQSLKLFHWEDGRWADVTTWVDSAGHTVYGEVTSFSWFFIGDEWVWVDDGVGEAAALRVMVGILTLSERVLQGFVEVSDVGPEGKRGLYVSLTDLGDSFVGSCRDLLYSATRLMSSIMSALTI
jgi:hypothetical protein